MPITKRRPLKIDLPDQKVIRVRLSFYSEAERQKLKSYPTYPTIEKLVSDTIEIPVEEFLTYYLFHRQRLNSKVYASYKAINRQVQTAAAALEGVVEFSDDSLRIPQDVDTPLKEATEHIGEAIGLSIASRIHNLNEADWSAIPQEHGRRASPSFDFFLASDGGNFVELEAKGSAVNDNKSVTDSIRTHARNITHKKSKLAAKQSPSKAALRYGAISVLQITRTPLL